MRACENVFELIHERLYEQACSGNPRTGAHVCDGHNDGDGDGNSDDGDVGNGDAADV